MSTIGTFNSGKGIAAVKGAPETIKGMLSRVLEGYDETFKWFTRRGARVLALGWREGPSLSGEKVRLVCWGSVGWFGLRLGRRWWVCGVDCVG